MRLLIAVSALVASVSALSQPVSTEDAVRASEKLEKPTTPVAKVVELLRGLSAKVAEAGKEEAIAYDRFACFCKEQADDKLHAVESSNKTIQEQEARIEELDAHVVELAEAIKGLGETIEEKEEDILEMEGNRSKEHEAYANKSAEVDVAIDAVERAMEALQESKADAESALSTLTSVVRSAVTKGDLALTARQAKVIASQKPAGYKFHSGSNDIIETLKGLRDTFKADKAEFDRTEFDARSLFEKERLGLQNQAKFAAEEKAQKEKASAKAEAEKTETEEAMAEEAKAKEADEAFLKVLTSECEEKAEFWDQRSKTRAAELTAIAQAIEALETGVVPKASANKELTDLQVKRVVSKSARAPSFLQLRGSASSAEKRSAELLKVLDRAAERLGGPLSLAALRVRSLVTSSQPATDHFVKIRSIINDLINKLEAQALAEQTQKDFCDESMAKAVKDRDEAASKKEEAQQGIATKEAEADQLAAKIAEISADIAKNKKALMEATELRGEEKAENEKVVADAGAGKEAVSQAIKVLNDFYASDSFLQRRASYTPPDADRSGATVADLAPKVFDVEYHGDQDGAKGIIGMLRVIHADFERTETVTGDEESSAASEFSDFKEENEKDTLAKRKEIEGKEGQVATLKEELVTLKEDISAAKKDHENTLEELDRLKEMCVEGTETYEEKVEKRTQEVEALKQALDVLEGYKSA